MNSLTNQETDQETDQFRLQPAAAAPPELPCPINEQIEALNAATEALVGLLQSTGARPRGHKESEYSHATKSAI